MTNPIYPDKTKTGLAALKPLTDVFFAEPERWEWEIHTGADWEYRIIDEAIKAYTLGHNIRLTPKPRRVWIGDQGYPEPVSEIQLRGQHYYVADLLSGCVKKIICGSVSCDWVRNGLVFEFESDAQQCLDAHRRARRVE